MNKFVFVSGIVILISTLGFFLVNQEKLKKSNPPMQQSASQNPSIIKQNQVVDYTAGFAIFTNGTFRVFTASKYHNQSEDVFIQADNPNIVQIKKSGTTWNNFFKTLPFKLTKDCLTTGTGETFCTNTNDKLQFYLNGREDSDALDKEIKSKDRLLVTYGNENEQQIQNQLQKIPIVK